MSNDNRNKIAILLAAGSLAGICSLMAITLYAAAETDAARREIANSQYPDFDGQEVQLVFGDTTMISHVAIDPATDCTYLVAASRITARLNPDGTCMTINDLQALADVAE